MPVAVPNGEAEAHAKNSVTAALSPRKLGRHRAHLIVFGAGAPRRSLEELARFTQVLAAIVQVSNAVGVYCGDAGATHEAKAFLEMARDADHLLPLWCGVEVVDDSSGRLSILTLGMRRQLGIMDLRLTAPKSQAAEAIPLAYDLLAYAVQPSRT
jgi:hypothetical protein